MRYVIIGNSAAGIFAAEAIRKTDKAGRVDIISDEHFPAYARCLTSYYLSGQMADNQMFIRPEDFYRRNNLHLHTGQKVTGIDREIREVYTDTGDIYVYDKLLLATGASPVIPEIPGVHNQGVFGLRTLADAKSILAFSAPGKHALVVGGGFVALKAAYALLKAKMSVTCIVSSGQILSQMLDRNAAAMVAEVLTSRGLRIKYHTDVVEILNRQDTVKGTVVSGVRLANGEEIPADVVIIGKGVTPNTGFLGNSGIKVGHGVPVNRYMQTNLPDIYAAGDVAQVRDIISGESKLNAIWPNATEQGTVAGLNMAGLPTVYPGSIGMNSADFFGLSTIAAGLTRTEGAGYEVVSLFPGPNLYRRLVFKGDTLVGYIMVGKTAQAGLLTSLVKEQIPLGKMKEELMLGRIRQRVLW